MFLCFLPLNEVLYLSYTGLFWTVLFNIMMRSFPARSRKNVCLYKQYYCTISITLI
jgi:hypothetical protein